MRRPNRETGAGTLDQRVTVKRIQETSDGAGGFTKADVTVGTLWAHVEPVRGQERVIADQQRGVQTYRLTVRNTGTGAAIVPSDKIEWGSITLNVRSAPDASRALFRVIEAESGVET